ncbi:uncharacterized protein SPPG_06735 [Spizellomyces punctatus DAOM BR117]|uniref:TLC domain-containing protein n=1 Tax=Spizellomyces punctatus (strain DAOM BR117) TaxID=645134 RepID=A0A0L0HA11_SPIPD|nr:uncharacterized protein SPPG_06735 [Spizellomyces punctatus DAOM BR117]KNC97734.1 hypothetical protein SPPG_06735 [Spizellomyces punctatus DAOM BR117]|eukprot:XP_016605774.1 hypothetical protein SPPG_06735 [Spizellomyces punctatus DAOM BR117]
MAGDAPHLAFQATPLYPHTTLSLPNPLLRLLNYNPKTGLCHKGWNDFILASLFAALFLVLRRYLYTAVFPVLAKRMRVAGGRMNRLKFSEQAWLFICHTASCVAGSILLVGKDYAPALFGEREGQKHFWFGYPHTHRFLDPVFKLFYFSILGYWLHHCAALAIEGFQRVAFERAKLQGRRRLAHAPKRSDFWPLAAHHAITVALVATSYYMNFTRVGHIVIILLDVADIFLPLAKILKYTRHQTICDVAFAVFTVSWVITRHWYLLLVCVSMWRDSLLYIPETSRVWDPWGTECFYSMKVYWLFLGLFAALQILLLYWLALIVKVVIKVVRGGTAEDVRSDDEEEETEDTLEPNEGQSKSLRNRKPRVGRPLNTATLTYNKGKRSGSGVELRSGDWDAVKEGEFRRRH